MPITKEIVQESIDKTKEEVDFAILDWKGLGKSQQRQQVIDILDSMYIRYKKSNKIKK